MAPNSARTMAAPGLSARRLASRPSRSSPPGDVALGDDDAVGHRRLLDRFAVPAELDVAIDPVDRRHHAVERVAVGDHPVGHQGMDDRRRVGQAGGLDHHPGERRDVALDALDEQLAQGAGEVVADGAAKAACVEQHRILVDPLDQMVVEPDLAELVDQYGRIRHLGMFQQSIDKGGFSAPQKTGQQGGLHDVVGLGRGVGAGHFPYSSAGSISTSAIVASRSSRTARKKQLRRPVWQATPVWSTASSSVSPSQSRRSSTSACT